MLARIHRPAKTAMQSGKAGAKRWVLEFTRDTAMAPDPLMGWISGADTNGQVRVYFDTSEEAVAFATARGIAHVVEEARVPKPVIKSYSENFAFNRREPWSH